MLVRSHTHIFDCCSLLCNPKICLNICIYLLYLVEHFGILKVALYRLIFQQKLTKIERYLHTNERIIVTLHTCIKQRLVYRIVRGSSSLLFTKAKLKKAPLINDRYEYTAKSPHSVPPASCTVKSKRLDVCAICPRIKTAASVRELCSQLW